MYIIMARQVNCKSMETHLKKNIWYSKRLSQNKNIRYLKDGLICAYLPVKMSKNHCATLSVHRMVFLSDNTNLVHGMVGLVGCCAPIGH